MASIPVFGQTGDGVKWAQEAIDSHATMRYLDPPSRLSETKWQVVKIEGCQVELRQSWHRESPETVFRTEGIFGRSEDKTIHWSFDLRELQVPEIMADTSTGLAHIKIFTRGDIFHLKTDFVSRAVRPDGTVVETTNWSSPGNARNLWMYFNSPDADNKSVVRRVAAELQGAIRQCPPERVAKHGRSPKVVVAATLR